MTFWNPSLYLNPKLIDKNNLDTAKVEEALADYMESYEGIAYAVTRTNIESGNVPDTPIMNKLVRAFHPTRSGNVLLIQDQFWYLYPNPDQFAAMHGSPYAYYTHVPILMSGPGISNKMVHRSVAVSDIVPTMARFLNVRMPSGADGNPLGGKCLNNIYMFG
ncbi:MAG: hypothetical protein U5P41_12835 [Gammaproteobacteria bacterium]|nr:hypothetical protein [Gammaproteobacteria bacterium]